MRGGGGGKEGDCDEQQSFHAAGRASNCSLIIIQICKISKASEANLGTEALHFYINPYGKDCPYSNHFHPRHR